MITITQCLHMTVERSPGTCMHYAQVVSKDDDILSLQDLHWLDHTKLGRLSTKGQVFIALMEI